MVEAGGKGGREGTVAERYVNVLSNRLVLKEANLCLLRERPVIAKANEIFSPSYDGDYKENMSETKAIESPNPRWSSSGLILGTRPQRVRNTISHVDVT